ncbi:hypothetical protein Q5741_21195 [Paenibacillus sp. JX-17]|uniref:Uncharacterized protein n=1 Tax=Paenibacillus lacisoli TaxID=3064525 RepID=A0ABT9CI16_9BACL|nr:hypothetical protein [Paenibacillus sp. JX-17]MDO7908895.1 hypothetical protein [Paenibacillus sp. JX-17]
MNEKDVISDFELDDVVAVLISICEVFEQSEMVSFVVSGFGQEKWPVDCRTDLATVIEQIPDILEKVSKGIFSFELNFYEQGIERQLVFEEEGGLVRVTCMSRTNWIPNPNTILFDKVEVSTMFNNFHKKFLEYSSVLCTDLANNPLLENWKKWIGYT